MDEDELSPALHSKLERILLTLVFLSVTVCMVCVPAQSRAWTYYFANDVHRGVTSEAVSQLQTYLTEQGYFHFEVTGYFGPITFAAVKAWQAANGIPSTGYFGPISRAFVNARALIVPTTNSSSPSTTPPAAVDTGFQPFTPCTKMCGGVMETPSRNSISITNTDVPPPVSISVTGPGAVMYSDATGTFTANVLNTANTAVTWSAALGSIDASGVYTPPPLYGTLTPTDVITATSVADPTKSASTSIVVGSGLAGEWPLDEGTGTTALDSSGSGVNGTWHGTASGTGGTYYSDTAFASSYAGYFNGTDDYIDMGNNALFNAQAVTMFAWVYVTDDSVQRTVMGKEEQYKFAVHNGHFEILNSCDGTEWSTNTAVAGSVPLNTWTLATFVVDGPNAVDRFYINGSLVSTSTNCGAITHFNNNDFEVGAYAGANGPFEGIIDDPRFYDRAITTAQLQAYYYLLPPPPPPSVIVTPSTTTMLSGATTTFTATFSNDPGDSAMWSAFGGGTINPASGAYTAPTVYATTTVTVAAQSQTIEAVSSTATVTVIPRPVTIAISPTSTSLFGGATTTFTATTTNASTSAVTWSATFGTITASGTYTAPTDIGTSTILDTVTATSVADNTKVATATVMVTSGLAALWPVNEGGGSTAFDHSGNGNNGTWHGTGDGDFGGYYVQYGILQHAGAFDGATDYVSTSVSWPTSGSISVWADPMSLNSWASPAGWKFAPSSGGYILLDEGGSGNWRAVFNSSAGSEVDIQSTSSIPTTAWSYLTMTWNKAGATTTIALYVNGVSQGSTTTVQNATSSIGSFYFGTAGQSTNNDFTGAIDNVRVYNRALTPAEVQVIYSAEQSVNSSVPIILNAAA